jgi:hypothetical protein
LQPFDNLQSTFSERAQKLITSRNMDLLGLGHKEFQYLKSVLSQSRIRNGKVKSVRSSNASSTRIRQRAPSHQSKGKTHQEERHKCIQWTTLALTLLANDTALTPEHPDLCAILPSNGLRTNCNGSSQQYLKIIVELLDDLMVNHKDVAAQLLLHCIQAWLRQTNDGIQQLQQQRKAHHSTTGHSIQPSGDAHSTTITHGIEASVSNNISDAPGSGIFSDLLSILNITQNPRTSNLVSLWHAIERLLSDGEQESEHGGAMQRPSDTCNLGRNMLLPPFLHRDISTDVWLILCRFPIWQQCVIGCLLSTPAQTNESGNSAMVAVQQNLVDTNGGSECGNELAVSFSEQSTPTLNIFAQLIAPEPRLDRLRDALHAPLQEMAHSLHDWIAPSLPCATNIEDTLISQMLASVSHTLRMVEHGVWEIRVLLTAWSLRQHHLLATKIKTSSKAHAHIDEGELMKTADGVDSSSTTNTSDRESGQSICQAVCALLVTDATVGLFELGKYNTFTPCFIC